MFQLRPSVTGAFDPMLVREPLVLRSPIARDYEAWVRVRAESRAHLIRWEDDWTDADLSLTAYRRRLRAWERQRRMANGFSLFAFRADDEALVGGISLSHVRFGALQSGVIGYWIGAQYLRQGYASLMLDETLAHIFEVIGLNRIEAACQPENEASANLLKRQGFRKEGCARDYLRINGHWRDHDIYSRLAADPPSQPERLAD